MGQMGSNVGEKVRLLDLRIGKDVLTYSIHIIFYGFDPCCPFSESTFVWEKLSLSAAQGIGSIPNPESVPPLLPPSDSDCGGE